MTKGKPGRPSKLTPELQEKIVTAIRAGNYAEIAAGYAGIGTTTYYRWMQQGEEQSSGRYREFREAVKAAEGEAEIRAVAMVQKQMPEHWQAAMTYLERKFPARWGRRMDVTSGDQPVSLGVLVVPERQTLKEWTAKQVAARDTAAKDEQW
jgi:hypothetical protein